MPEQIQSPRTNADETAQEWLRRYIRERLDSEGEFYCKSKFVAEDAAFSARELGAAMGRLSESATEFTVEKWSYTNATTWRIAPA